MEKPRITTERIVAELTVLALLLTSCAEASATPTRGTTTLPGTRVAETSVPPETRPKNQSPEVRCSAPGADDPNAIIKLTFKRIDKDTLDMTADRDPGTAATKPDQNKALTPYGEFVRTGVDLEIPIGRQGDNLVTTNLNKCLVLQGEKEALEEFFKDLIPKSNNNTQTFFKGKPVSVMDTQVNPKDRINPFAGQQNIRFEVGRGSKPQRPLPGTYN